MRLTSREGLAGEDATVNFYLRRLNKNRLYCAKLQLDYFTIDLIFIMYLPDMSVYGQDILTFIIIILKVFLCSAV